jgi:hypothetical protein
MNIFCWTKSYAMETKWRIYCQWGLAKIILLWIRSWWQRLQGRGGKDYRVVVAKITGSWWQRLQVWIQSTPRICLQSHYYTLIPAQWIGNITVLHCSPLEHNWLQLEHPWLPLVSLALPPPHWLPLEYNWNTPGLASPHQVTTGKSSC